MSRFSCFSWPKMLFCVGCSLMQTKHNQIMLGPIWLTLPDFLMTGSRSGCLGAQLLSFSCPSLTFPQGADRGQAEDKMLEFIPWIPASCDSRLRPRSWGAAEPGQNRRSEDFPHIYSFSSALPQFWHEGLNHGGVCCHAGADPYLIISCEGRSVKSTIKKDTLQPEFATSAIFYRKKPRKPVTVEVRWKPSSDGDSLYCQRFKHRKSHFKLKDGAFFQLLAAESIKLQFM